jgi:hypothetical protein
MNKIIILYISIYIFLFPSACFNVPGTAVQPSQINQYDEPSENIQKPQSGGGGGRMNIQIETIDDSGLAPVSIKKELIKHDYNYYIREPLQVRVELKVMGKKVNDLQIIEYVDNELKIDSFSNCIILNDIKDIALIDPLSLDTFNKTKISGKIVEESIKNNESKFNKLKNNFTVYNYIPEGDIIEFNIKNYYYNYYLSDLWNEKSRLIYWYNITPEKSGIYKTKTIVRTSGESADVDETLEFRVADPIPKFSIDADVDKLELKSYDWPEVDWLEVEYNIRYLGGASDPYLCDISLEQGKYRLKENLSYISDILTNNSFKSYELKSIALNLSWNSSNKYYIPNIHITDKDNNRDYPTNFTFKEREIVVKSFWEINKEIIYWLLLVSTLIFGYIFNKEINETIKSYYYRLKRKCKPCKISYRKCPRY